ncbi:hypothetical protein TIFTF001_003336 [Ficus carica]|uniref:Uncharacterized protein n=1 Tax=Ficus carica TaxID=3494 RepID=A0AA87ZRD2_FICCA|nr:hypothetical protein TIFTF001_003336 [Ficus carica]
MMTCLPLAAALTVALAVAAAAVTAAAVSRQPILHLLKQALVLILLVLSLLLVGLDLAPGRNAAVSRLVAVATSAVEAVSLGGRLGHALATTSTSTNLSFGRCMESMMLSLGLGLGLAVAMGLGGCLAVLSSDPARYLGRLLAQARGVVAVVAFLLAGFGGLVALE